MSHSIFFRPLRVERIPPGGKQVQVEASAEERRAVAIALGIPEVTMLQADVEVRRQAGDAVGVKGALTASVVQTDVVTLESVAQEIAEEIDVTLMPAETGAGRPDPADATSVEDRDLYSSGEVDLGAIVIEHLALGLNPYPRGEGVSFSDHIEDDSAASPSPFAALKNLKRDRNDVE
jgi:uncharacterized metal-binding protein YceD (DUF177 family)